jgi:peptidoglycan-associated lipoprotein
MNRKLMIWMVVPLVLVAASGCRKKPPQTPADDLPVETTTVETPTPPPATDIPDTTDQAANDEQEIDPLSSQDLQVVNQELARRGFSADIYFDYDESGLSDDARNKLARNAELLRAQPQFLVTIEGHADERGTNEYNLALGERRANAVRSYLGSLGIGGDRLRTLAYGEERPVCTESAESCWSQNRRAHLIITGRSNVG